MKISSASKKVLASALSAAMVVAFAPTVAFGQVVPGDQVTVKFDTTGLTVKSMNSEFSADGYTAGVNADNVLTLPTAATSGHDYMFDANTQVAGWYFDADDNGKYDASKDITLASGGVLDFTNASNLVNAGNTITLKPFKAVAAGVSIADTTTVKQKYSVNDKFTVSLSNSKTSAADNLRVSIAKDGTEVAYALASVDAATTGQDGKVTPATKSVEFTVIGKDAETKTAGQIKANELGKGKYTVTVSDAASLKAVATSEFEVVSVHADGLFNSENGKNIDQVGQDILMVVGESVESQLNAAASEIDVRAAKAKADNKSYEDAVAYKVGDKKAVVYGNNTWSKATSLDKSVKVAADTALTPMYGDAATAGELTIDSGFSKLTASVDAPQTGAEYDFELTGPVTATKTKVAAANAASVDVYAFDSNGAKAGKYTVTITQVKDRGTNLEEKTVIGSATLTLTQLTYDAGEGKLASGVSSTKIVKAGTKYGDAGLLAANTTNADGTTKINIEPKSGYRFVGWSTDGTTVVDAKAKVGEEATTLKAVYAANTAAEPTVSYADGKLTITNNAGDGYEVKYGTSLDSNKGIANPVTYSSPITVDVEKVDTIYVQTVKKSTTTGLASSAVVTVTNYKATANSVENWVKLAAANTTGASTVAAPQYYSKVLDTLASDAKAAIKALSYGTAKSWSKAALEQETAALKAIADYESAQIDSYVSGVTAADGTLKKASSIVAEKQKAEIVQVLTDFEYNNDKKDETKAKGSYTNASAASEYVQAIAKASKAVIDASVTYAKADVDAAAAVTTSLKAAKTGAEAKAAIEAYNKLTSTQKELVASADVAAAQEIATKAEADEAAKALVEAQDEAAIAAVKGKTVKAKAKKATKSSLKVVTSKSGAKSTFKKATKNSKVTVSSAGKITVKKGLKAGKTYKVKVKATVGAQTKTVTVTVKVAK